MELRSLFQIIFSRWWIVLPVLAIVLVVTVALTIIQEPEYQATARLIVAPAVDVQDQALSALAVISRQSEITDTYAQIASSRTVQGTAAEELGLTDQERSSVTMTSRLITGTTLLEVSAMSPDPALASDYANAVSNALVAYVNTSNPIFEVDILDAATPPSRPQSPDVPVNLGLGTSGGLLLGIGLALVAYLLTPPAKAGLRDVVDPETWAFNDTFFVYRLSQEVSRTRRTREPTSVALIDVNHEGAIDELLPRLRLEAIRRIATLIDSHVRPEDVVARLHGTVFGVILPDTSEEQAVAMIESLRGRISAPALGTLAHGAPAHANPAAGVVEFREGNVDIMQQAQSALRAAKEGPIGRTEAFSALSVQAGT